MAAALRIATDGDIQDIHLPEDSNSLPVLYAEIGCTAVDVVAITSQWDMWLDDEGLYTKPVNPLATALARHYGHTWQPYHGTVIIAAVTKNGDSADLNRDQLRALLTTLLDIVGDEK